MQAIGSRYWDTTVESHGEGARIHMRSRQDAEERNKPLGRYDDFTPTQVDELVKALLPYGTQPAGVLDKHLRVDTFLHDTPATISLSPRVEAARGLLRDAVYLLDQAAPTTSSAQLDMDDTR